ncbi:MAG: Heat-inducible transcription repressor hrcA [Microgenomates group bacterium GW2011_GWF2_45_18]|nr:MAG: Heat-inducible transcription repressor hrcA [Microgenomates group bacterium GW2011_GWF1_44_10]KKU02157.1 MAG: Heat-inducible transcription repressor hrcA [Microgenomates group bacterium GW2011_GWF2_45_18]OGJ41595.1 MAG: hypothetical protein A2378_04090 [Candidatus Pacebacteria bacterium RIFOXYB1_FULL_44_10]HAU98707.1 hypothetical protein [Candidatus Paceibacterota bacterium]HAX01867.1 hypothetical protein [Candidatus Paceibacterota bacterium]
MIDLTSRQIQILKAVIEEYLKTAEPIGSDTIDRKFNLGVSPATIRSELAYLGDQGYLKQPHSSAGRVPTPMALKLYVQELMNKKDLSVADEVSVKERMWESRHKFDSMLHEATRVLSERAQSVGVAVTADHQAFHSGYSHLLSIPEFEDLDVARTVFQLLEETRQLESIFLRDWGGDMVHMVFGGDLGNRYLEPVGILFTEFQCADQRCMLGVIGSSRIDYAYMIPFLEYMHGLLEEFHPSLS